MASIDDLIGKLDDAKVDPTNLGEHPHFSKFKNAAAAAERQAQRRREFMEHQKEQRQDQYNRYRNLIDAKDDIQSVDMDEDAKSDISEQAMDLSFHAPNCRSPRNMHKINLKYADQLMLSEWLIDIPEQLSNEWYMVPAPIGKHVLVVASRGITSTYDKRGKLMNQFESPLPGGSRANKGRAGNFTILDCLLWRGIKFYCLDLLSWGGNVMTDNPFDFRRFMLNSKLEEDPRFASPDKFTRKSFLPIPMCKCDKQAMEAMMATEFPFDVDGLLFYHSSVLYEAGQNPLVAWLKPWMLPELLGINVPEKYLRQNSENQTSREFINAFNLKHNFKSLAEQEKDAEVEESEKAATEGKKAGNSANKTDEETTMK